MKKSIALLLSLAAVSTGAFAVDKAPAPAFTGPNLSGTYICTGTDSHDGDFKATMTLALDKKNSRGVFGGYTFVLKGDHDVYRGSAATNGNLIAVTFANDDPKPKDFGTAIGKVTEEKAGGYKIEKFYFEPEYKGGGNGVEVCVSQR
jgi:hypothetical protein